MTESEKICFDLSCFVDIIRDYIAGIQAISSFNKTYHTENNCFLLLAQSSMEQQMLLEIKKLLDPEETFGNKNCSFLLLKANLLEKQSSSQIAGFIVNEIDNLQGACEDCISRDIRNKKMAHHDLNSVNNTKLDDISFSRLIQLVEKMLQILKASFLLMNGGEYTVPPLEKKTVFFSESIKNLLDINNSF